MLANYIDGRFVQARDATPIPTQSLRVSLAIATSSERGQAPFVERWSIASTTLVERGLTPYPTLGYRRFACRKGLILYPVKYTLIFNNVSDRA